MQQTWKLVDLEAQLILSVLEQSELNVKQGVDGASEPLTRHTSSIDGLTRGNVDEGTGLST